MLITTDNEPGDDKAGPVAMCFAGVLVLAFLAGFWFAVIISSHYVVDFAVWTWNLV